MDREIDYGNAERYENDESIEMAWAIQAADRATIHMNLIMTCDTTKLKLNKYQDNIYATFRKDFPDLDVTKVTQDQIKEPEAKEKWRQFCEQFKEVEDFSLGSLFRIEANKCYSPENTFVVPKIQYLAIEIARNLEGVNERFKAEYTEDQKINGQS